MLTLRTMTIRIAALGKTIHTDAAADRIFEAIKAALQDHDDITLDFDSVKMLDHECSGRIFRRLYNEMGPEVFYERIALINIPDSLYEILKQSLFRR